MSISHFDIGKAPDILKKRRRAEAFGSTVAIIDDLESNRTFLEHLALRLPEIRRVFTFQSAKMALAVFEADPPDLIITDFNMPEMNAVAFLEALRQTPELQDVPVIVVSSHTETENRYRALQAGATDFLMLPFDTFEFQARTRNLLRLSLHQKALKSQSLSLHSELVETRHLSMQTRDRFTTIIDSVPALVFSVNTAGECIFANQFCFDFLGLSGGDGLRGLQLLAGKMAGGTETGPDGLPVAREISLIGQDQLEHVFLIVPRPVICTKEKKDFTVYSGIEITRLKETERSLRRAKEEAEVANRAKSAFLSNMTHEIRTPLNAIIGFTDMICNELHGPIGNERYKSYLADVQSSANHLLAIINEILDFSQIEAKRHTATLTRFSLRACLAEICNLTKHQVNLNGNWLLLDEIPDVIIESDQQKLGQVLLNIVTNANKAVCNDVIRISALRTAGGGLVVTVQDQGIGMDAAELQIAMTEFGRISHSAFVSNSQPGTGLGLPISIAFMKLLGGNLEIESERGVGTKVRICLPQSAIYEREGVCPPSQSEDRAAGLEA
ncbi:MULTISPECIES: response regulator [Rhodomicrobium]|uniref:ATP-binding response regulator n=1 Tax=Rhodomicrobium TaxID=1068 RepID=UPI000B4B0B7F|nr:MULTISPECIES: response regulator [Rhodomicrobium]